MNAYEEFYIKRCIFCEKPSCIVVGVAVGAWGNDYGICKKCLNTKTIKELLTRKDEIDNQGE